MVRKSIKVMGIAKHQIFCGRRFSELDGYKQLRLNYFVEICIVAFCILYLVNITSFNDFDIFNTSTKYFLLLF